MFQKLFLKNILNYVNANRDNILVEYDGLYHYPTRDDFHFPFVTPTISHDTDSSNSYIYFAHELMNVVSVSAAVFYRMMSDWLHLVGPDEAELCYSLFIMQLRK